MATAKRPTPAAFTYVLRTKTMRTEYKGRHTEGLVLAFISLPSASTRAKVLVEMQRAHEKQCEREQLAADGDHDQGAQ